MRRQLEEFWWAFNVPVDASYDVQPFRVRELVPRWAWRLSCHVFALAMYTLAFMFGRWSS